MLQLPGKSDCRFNSWIAFGATQTLLSYGIDIAVWRRSTAKAAVDEKIRELYPILINRLFERPADFDPDSKVFCLCMLVSAQWSTSKTEGYNLTLIRDEFYKKCSLSDYIFVIRPHAGKISSAQNNRLNIDTVLYRSGVLSAVN